ncbi:MAG: TetR/AcrR family transcriptional regulator [Limosilactobacillus pontis]|uniref:TetR family transcriptional regulator n=1 Tax=Limosilactobacillus pontis TaxID=35787 RepID=A0A2J6NM07_9LACO|nr:TetR/AcrR family transcriptional regulator [Limosilactobacillus pontis]PMB82343.1 TetR family transcriptional regulator [Limosilactobacillus pontis]
MRVTRTVRDFQNALMVLLETNSFDHLTVDQICKEALLHRSSFYRYFNDKYDLLEQTLKAQVVRIVDNGNSSEDDIVKQVVLYIDQHRDMVRHLAASDTHSSLYSELLQILTQMFLERSEQESNDPVIQALQKSDNPELLAYTLSGAILGGFHWWQSKNYNVPVEEVINFVRETVHSLSDEKMCD